ncbi:Baseplate J-like protein [Caballeronia pedi]|uniref:Baseplate J-like protein n=1 Tax=Caballeronia pedi TaxID=1777141 RepID=A0A158DVG6_9BURK|nr:baseplate J/gp47 family protein [Caballeronia pedi]SAK98611.1 Baseplate J-like protein [Caballeronia pedi]
MAFQIKDFTSIVASMINWMKGTQTTITDFNEGAIARTLVEAPAAELDELYQEMFIGLKEAIPVATYNTFSFAALPARPTTGLIRTAIAAAATNQVIPAGTVYSYAGGTVTYTSENDTTITVGNTYADVLVSANVSGTAGNIAAGTQFTAAPDISGFVSATNLSPFINGSDVESDDERKVRFQAFIDALSRGPVEAIKYGLKTTQITDSSGNVIERVVSAQVVEPYETDNNQPVGLVVCYIHNGVGQTSNALVTQAQKVVYGYTDSSGNKIAGWKAAGVHVDVYAATEQAVPVAAVLTADIGYDKATLVAQAVQTIYTYIQGLDTGVPCLFADIITLVKNIEGVANFVVSTPTADVTPASNVKLMPGTVAVS